MRYLIVMLLAVCMMGRAQDSLPFEAEVAEIQKKYDTLWDASKETIVFTGSSSVRLWKDLATIFPEQQIVNSGFGGSQASDLLIHSEKLILRFNPKKVFIYEGDNDISSKKKPKRIIADIQQIIALVKEHNKATQIVLLSAKPSIARWHLRRKYRRLNRRIREICERDTNLAFANVWDIMLNGRKLRTDLFIADGLHMNAKGYALWQEVITKYIK
ncbi:GDSL-type esterase/lipase family protein [Flavobacteriaceae bacterium 3-367]|uniref:GDSL-type esterase/lipase family protein n=1 Tax=Eudoraea algarum TaxID=3417568 RepID=UPI0032850721